MKRIISMLTITAFVLNTTVFAGVLGEISGGYTNDMGLGTFFHKTEFSGSERGNQTEHFIEYTPNEEMTPVVISGEELWGTIDMYAAQNVITADGLRSRGAINADFFSFKTGLSMGYTISDGEIVTKEYTKMPAIGFRNDGTAFIDDLQIKTTVYKGDNSAEILFINKWCQPGFDPIYLLTDYFGETTQTSSNCLYIIGTVLQGKISLQEDAKIEVEEIFEYEGEIKIPDGKVVLLIDVAGGNPECLEFMQSIEVGDELTVKNEFLNSKKNLWSEAVEACSTITPQLLENGKIGSGFDPGVNPRTAAGIKADGNVVLYTLDGRKTGYSTGATLEELAKRMQELGCLDAINFDGGGSTAIGAWLSDLPSFQILNRPSDGYPRKVANYIFLRDNRLPTGIPKYVKYKNLNKNVYIGSNQNLEIENVYDTADYEMSNFDVKISSENIEINENNLKFNTAGIATVDVVVNDLTDSVVFNVYDKIDSFKVYKTDTWKEVNDIKLGMGDEYSVQLRAIPYADENELLLNEGVKWEIEGNIGEISETGYLHLKPQDENGGQIRVTLAGLTTEIPVEVVLDKFYDMDGHWSREMVNELVEREIFTGIENEFGTGFFPDNNMTRAEFAITVCRYLGLNMEEYSQNELNFTDAQNIQPWAQNAIKAVVANGIMKGNSDDDGNTLYFAPDSSITRAEAMTVIGRTIQADSEYVADFADAYTIPSWAKSEVFKLVGLGIVEGYSDNTILPMKNVTRAEAASLIYKLLNR